ncbi:MAG: SHOCT domain-containing protein [Candidatus Methanoperedens sp.]|nr:SHOCT domain-containing protein [Candidatus Methanoperedens sp.]
MQFGMMDGYGYGVAGYGMLIFGFIFWILILIGLILLIKYLWEGGAKKEESALELLKKRYARGEISKEEFEEKKKDLV